MASNIDFVLPSCYGIPESMWLTASVMLDVILKRCWYLLGAFVVIKMIISAFIDLGEERFSLVTQFRILSQALLIAVFLTYYKTCLMALDYMIDSLCFFKEATLQQTVKHAEDDITSGEISVLQWLFRKLKISGVLLYTQKGISTFMHYIKCVSLLILALLGPFATLFSLLPGPFRSSFKTWSRGYINVSCWTITLAILDALLATFQSTVTQAEYRFLLSFVLFISTFFVPTWTAKLIGGVNLGNIAAGVGRGIGRPAEVAHKLMTKKSEDKK